MNPFAPQNILFFVSLAAGILMMVVNAVGGVSYGADSDHDVDHDTDGDHEDGLFSRAISAMGVGRAPLMLVLMIFFTIFGVSGLFLNLLLPGFAIVTHVGAFVFTVAITRVVSSRIAKWMPRTESYNVSKEDLVGCLGSAVYSITRTSGSAQVRDKAGDVYKVQARTFKDEVIPMNAEVVVVEYRDGDFVYIVTSVK